MVADVEQEDFIPLLFMPPSPVGNKLVNSGPVFKMAVKVIGMVYMQNFHYSLIPFTRKSGALRCPALGSHLQLLK
jgi:hypothetical protein